MQIKKLKTFSVLLCLVALSGCTSQTVLLKPSEVLLAIPSTYTPAAFQTAGDLLEQRNTYREHMLMCIAQVKELNQWYIDMENEHGK